MSAKECFATVRFIEDGIVYVCNTNRIRGDNCNAPNHKIVRYSNGTCYEAAILFTRDKESALKFSKSLGNNSPTKELVNSAHEVEHYKNKNWNNRHTQQIDIDMDSFRCSNLERSNKTLTGQIFSKSNESLLDAYENKLTEHTEEVDLSSNVTVAGSAKMSVFKRSEWLEKTLEATPTKSSSEVLKSFDRVRKTLKFYEMNSFTDESTTSSTLDVTNKDKANELETGKSSLEVKKSASSDKAAQNGSQIYSLLEPVDRIVASSFVHFFTRGKKESQVPIMIPVRQLPAFELFIQYRKEAEIKKTNPFLFGKPNGRCFDACAALRNLSKKSGAKEHRLLRSTLLRKHIATMSQILHLENGQLDILAQYMGHSLEVHRQFYRLPDQALHLAKISKLLMAVSTDNIEALRGKSLDALPVPSDATTVEYLMPVEDVNPADLEDSDIDSQDVAKEVSENDKVPAFNKGKKTNKAKAVSVLNISEIDHEDNKAPPCKENKRRPSKRKQLKKFPVVWTPWTDAEKNAVLQHFAHNIRRDIPIGKRAAEEVIDKEPALNGRH